MNSSSIKERRLQEVPELRESVEQLLVSLGEHLGADQDATLVAHVERTSPVSFSELEPFRERFLQDLPPAVEILFRGLGTFIWRLLFNVEEINLPGGPPRQPASYVRDDVKRLSAELRYVEGLCALIVEAGSPKTSSEEKLLDSVEGLGGILGAVGDLLEQQLGKRSGRRRARPRAPRVIDGRGPREGQAPLSIV